jgi:hypothetical protein
MPDAWDADDCCIGQARRCGLGTGEGRQRIEAARDEKRRDAARDGLAHGLRGGGGPSTRGIRGLPPPNSESPPQKNPASSRIDQVIKPSVKSAFLTLNSVHMLAIANFGGSKLGPYNQRFAIAKCPENAHYWDSKHEKGRKTNEKAASSFGHAARCLWDS